jgi:hypothetical protein
MAQDRVLWPPTFDRRIVHIDWKLVSVLCRFPSARTSCHRSVLERSLHALDIEEDLVGRTRRTGSRAGRAFSDHARQRGDKLASPAFTLPVLLPAPGSASIALFHGRLHLAAADRLFEQSMVSFSLICIDGRKVRKRLVERVAFAKITSRVMTSALRIPCRVGLSTVSARGLQSVGGNHK